MEYLIKWFEKIGHRYVNNILSIVDFERMKNDNEYSLKLFLYYWAFERKDAPGGYKIAGIKTITNNTRNKSLINEFQKYYKGKPNITHNPAMDERLKTLNLNCIINLVIEQNFQQAFESLKLNGLGHKIRSFFLRDVTYLSQISEVQLSNEDYLYLCPIDVWIRLTIDYLNINEQFSENIVRSKYCLPKKDFDTALKLIEICRKAKTSPLLTNMGIWYFCSRCVGDEGRLKVLLNDLSVKTLENELKLMGNFENFRISFAS